MGRGDHLRPDLLDIKKKNYQTMATNSSRVIQLIHVCLLSYFKRNSSRQWSGGVRIIFFFFVSYVMRLCVCVLQVKVEIAHSSVPHKGNQEVLGVGFHALDSGFQLLDSRFLSVELSLSQLIFHTEL